MEGIDLPICHPNGVYSGNEGGSENVFGSTSGVFISAGAGFGFAANDLSSLGQRFVTDV